MIEVFTYDEAAAKWRVPKETIVQAVNSGQLKAIKIGNNWIRLTEKGMDDWLRGLEGVQ